VTFDSVRCTYPYLLLLGSVLCLFVAGGCSKSNGHPEVEETDPASMAEEVTNQSGQINVLTEDEKKGGWELLFDGVEANDWTGTKAEGFPDKGWIIEDGVLTFLGAGHASGGDIITKEQYGNFELSLEFKIPKGANSGIKYFVVNNFPDHEGNYLGLEYQIIDDLHHADAKLGIDGNRTIASLYDMIPAKNKSVKPVGEWNHAKITVKGSHVEHWLNGSKVVEFERGSDDFRKLVAASKYRKLQGFGEMAVGHILLQGHGDTVHYRNIKIRNLAGS
jgi:hypothetical protein